MAPKRYANENQELTPLEGMRQDQVVIIDLLLDLIALQKEKMVTDQTSKRYELNPNIDETITTLKELIQEVDSLYLIHKNEHPLTKKIGKTQKKIKQWLSDFEEKNNAHEWALDPIKALDEVCSEMGVNLNVLAESAQQNMILDKALTDKINKLLKLCDESYALFFRVSSMISPEKIPLQEKVQDLYKRTKKIFEDKIDWAYPKTNSHHFTQLEELWEAQFTIHKHLQDLNVQQQKKIQAHQEGLKTSKRYESNPNIDKTVESIEEVIQKKEDLLNRMSINEQYIDKIMRQNQRKFKSAINAFYQENQQHGWTMDATAALKEIYTDMTYLLDDLEQRAQATPEPDAAIARKIETLLKLEQESLALCLRVAQIKSTEAVTLGQQTFTMSSRLFNLFKNPQYQQIKWRYLSENAEEGTKNVDQINKELDQIGAPSSLRLFYHKQLKVGQPKTGSSIKNGCH